MWTASIPHCQSEPQWNPFLAETLRLLWKSIHLFFSSLDFWECCSQFFNGISKLSRSDASSNIFTNPPSSGILLLKHDILHMHIGLYPPRVNSFLAYMYSIVPKYALFLREIYVKFSDGEFQRRICLTSGSCLLLRGVLHGLFPTCLDSVRSSVAPYGSQKLLLIPAQLICSGTVCSTSALDRSTQASLLFFFRKTKKYFFVLWKPHAAGEPHYTKASWWRATKEP